jgi:tRNA 2-thiouridine synthesizing protein A
MFNVVIEDFESRLREFVMPETQPDVILDTSGLACPLPVLKAKKAMAALQPGQVLLVIATDPGSVADFEVFCGIGGHTLLGHTHVDGIYRFQIARAAAK